MKTLLLIRLATLKVFGYTSVTISETPNNGAGRNLRALVLNSHNIRKLK